MVVYTSSLRYGGPDRVDITVKTGNKAFAPTWDMVMGYKSGRMTMTGYTEKYEKLMLLSQEAFPAEWQKLLQMDRIVLCCYCPRGQFCHRHLLADMLVQMGAKYGGEI